ncbi:MAG: AMP-binding protein [Flavobacteriales bacterium]|nr:AMP-binding protein [Flavobacteriales bacterium]
MSKYPQPLEMLYKWEKETPNSIYLRQPVNGEWLTWTWKEAGQEVRKMAAAIQKLGLPEKSKIAMISKNCAHWMICDLAIMMSGHISVPLYPNISADTLQKILTHSEAKVLFIGKLDDWKSLEPGLIEGVQGISFPIYPHEKYTQWEDLVKDVTPISEDVIRDPEELGTIIYTSGTTGMPKGVMHKFSSFGFATINALREAGIGPGSKFFSYLPLSHIAERLLVEMGGLYSGGTVSFAESLETFPKNLSDTQPTVFLGVPRIWTKFQQGVLAKLPQQKLDKLLKIPIISSIIKNKIKKGLGLSKARNVFTGAAPTPVALMEWFAKLGVYIQEAYAMTENCCYSHVTFNDNIKLGYVGRALPHCDVKIGTDDEVLIKHEAMMLGYYKEEEMTKEVFEGEYFRTGDTGEIDAEGFLKITGRVKDLFKTSKGKYVAPSPIELKIEANPHVEQVCLVGLGLPQPMALCVLAEGSKGADKSAVVKAFEDTLSNLNAQLEGHEKVGTVVLLNDEWTVENEILTPTMKIKRKKVDEKYGALYDKWWETSEKIVWQ